MASTPHPFETFGLSESLLDPCASRIVTAGEPGPALVGTAPVVAGPGRTKLVFDFGRETVGYALVTVTCDAAADIAVHYGESAAEALSDDPCDVGWYRKATDAFHMSAGQHELRSARRRGFRYVRLDLSVPGGCARVERVRAMQVNYPVDREGRFACSDPLLNRIWEISRLTTLLTRQQWYEDGIKRDGMLWAGDLRVQALCNALLYGDAALARKSLIVLANAQMPNGAIPSTGNNGGIGPEWQRNIEYMRDCGAAGSWHSTWLIANYGYDWLMTLREHWEHTGDTELVRSLWREAARTVDWVISDGNGERVMDLPQQGAWWYGSDAWMAIWRYAAVQAGLELASVANDTAIRDRCQKYLQGKATALCAAHVGAEGFFTDGNLQEHGRHATAAAVLSGIVTHEVGRQMFGNLACREGLRKELVGMAKFHIHRALMRCGMTAAALDDIRTYYGCMVAHDATTCWELCDQTAPDGALTLVNSRCHGWSAGPAYLFPAHLLGVQPAAPGFTRVRIAPDLAGLDWVEGVVPLPMGDLLVRWERGVPLRGTITLPRGVLGEIHLPGQPGAPLPLHEGENSVRS